VEGSREFFLSHVASGSSYEAVCVHRWPHKAHQRLESNETFEKVVVVMERDPIVLFTLDKG